MGVNPQYICNLFSNGFGKKLYNRADIAKS